MMAANANRLHVATPFAQEILSVATVSVSPRTHAEERATKAANALAEWPVMPFIRTAPVLQVFSASSRVMNRTTVKATAEQNAVANFAKHII